MNRYDVIIIGAGIAGLTQALALSQAGFKVALVDQSQMPVPWQYSASWDNRVFALTPASQALYQDLGVWPLLVARRIAAYEHMHLWWPGYPARGLTLNAADAAVPALGHIVEQNVLRDALLAQTTATCYWGNAWQTLEHSEAGCSLTLTCGTQLHAALLIAADGAGSLVRAHVANSAFTFSHQAKAIVATIRSEVSHRFTARQVFHAEGTIALLPLSDPHLSSLVWSVPLDKADSLSRLSAEALAVSLTASVDQALGELTVVSTVQSFPLQALCAHSFAMPGLSFIADAAHVIHPLAGLGLNLGLADVVCLTDRLCKARRLNRPLGHLTVLQPYARARKVAAKQMILLMCAVEKSGRFSANYPNLFSKLVDGCLGRKKIMKTWLTKFALLALNQ